MKGLCLSCAPDVGAAIESARTMGELQSASEAAMGKGRERGKNIDVDRERQLVCHNCKAQTKGAKFCPECGTKMAASNNCPNCYLDIPPGVKFCPDADKRSITNETILR